MVYDALVKLVTDPGIGIGDELYETALLLRSESCKAQEPGD